MPDLTKMSRDQLLNVLMIEIDYYRNARKHHPDEPRWKGSDVAEMLAGETEKVLAELTRRTEVPAGHVKLDDGRVVKVLIPSEGPQWYLTTDGCVVPNTSAFVWAYEMHPGCKFSGKVISMKYQTWFDTRWDDCLPARWHDKAPDGKWGCYSTEAAALAAKGVEREH